MNKTVLLIGGNVGDRFNYLSKCIELVKQNVGEIVQASSIYQTAPWGNTDQQDYLNQALEVETSLLPSELLAKCRAIENALGRKRDLRWGERTLDVDIIFYNQLIINSEKLLIPHPRYTLRNFVLIPLNEIIPNYICPEHKEPIASLLKKCTDDLAVSLVSELDFSLA